MEVDTLRRAAHVVVSVASSPTFRDRAGSAVAVFTTWGFAVFALLAAAAFVGAVPAVRSRLVVTTAVGTVAAALAAGIGLAVKHVVAEPRPCQVNPALAQWTSCPAPGSWSFPSNHSVWAAALAVTVVALGTVVGRRWIVAAGIVLALGIGASRVVLGVHYWWDVVAGLTLGAAVAALALRVITRPAQRFLDRHVERRPVGVGR